MSIPIVPVYVRDRRGRTFQMAAPAGPPGPIGPTGPTGMEGLTGEPGVPTPAPGGAAGTVMVQGTSGYTWTDQSKCYFFDMSGYTESFWISNPNLTPTGVTYNAYICMFTAALSKNDDHPENSWTTAVRGGVMPASLQPGGPMYDMRCATGNQTSASFEYYMAANGEVKVYKAKWTHDWTNSTILPIYFTWPRKSP